MLPPSLAALNSSLGVGKRIVFPILVIAILFERCIQERQSHQGHYIYLHDNPGEYETADVYDSIVIVNKDALDATPDTIWFDSHERKFIRSTPNERTYRNLKFENRGQLVLYAQYDDPGIWSQLFVRAKPEYEEDLFSLCKLKIELPSYESGMTAQDLMIQSGYQRVYIGQPKNKSFPKAPDESPYIQVQDVFIQAKAIDQIIALCIRKEYYAIVLHFDKHVGEPDIQELRASFIKKSNGLKILEAKLKDARLVYVQLN